MNGKTLITGALLVDKQSKLLGTSGDILISDGRIEAVGARIPPQDGWEIINLDGKYLSPGFTDTHTHLYTATKLGVQPDSIGIRTGVTTLFDAGSAGPENLEDFIQRDVKPSQTRVLSLMHFVKTGLINTPEADSPEKYDVEYAVEAAKRHSDFVVGIKARASNSTVGKMGIVPIRAAKEVARRAGIPMMVHIGNPPPDITEVLDLLDAGDVITHSYHGKINGLLENGAIKEATQRARARGVLFDVGHGVASFSFKTAKAAFAQGFTPDTISTDLHSRNINGPVYSLTKTMDKMLALGIPLYDCVNMVTGRPAELYNLLPRGIGRLERGFLAEFTVFRLAEGIQKYQDADGNEIEGSRYIDVTGVFVNGQQINLLKGE